MTTKLKSGLFRTILWPVFAGLVVEIISTTVEVLRSPPDGGLTFSYFATEMLEEIWVGLIVALVVFIWQCWAWLQDMKVDLLNAHLVGMYRLVEKADEEKGEGEKAEGFKKLEDLITKTTRRDSGFRGMILDYVLKSMQEQASTGFAIVDQSVDTYVRYITDLVNKSDSVSATCVVRPYWFVTEGIPQVALPPHIPDRKKFGKSEHLACFKKPLLPSSSKWQRILIVDEAMVADVLLTAAIDIKGSELSSSDCPFCNGKVVKDDCAFHGKKVRKTVKSYGEDVPEIGWFSDQVNKGRGVDLIYTVVAKYGMPPLRELDDRVYAQCDGEGVDLRFEFTSHEKGAMRLFWGGSGVVPLEHIRWFNQKVCPKSGNQDANGHKFYKNFADCLNKDGLREGMLLHLKTLKGAVDRHFNQTNVTATPGEDSAVFIKRHLCSGSYAFKAFVEGCIDELMTQVRTESLADIYKNQVTHYATKKSVPQLAYAITMDIGEQRYPIRVARVDENWKGICNARR